jgi:diguanylate cyclase (GGDEF)-like protein/PAS domain S-box-containing protein
VQPPPPLPPRTFHLEVIAASVAILDANPDGTYTYADANARYLDMLGAAEADVVGRSPSDVLPGYLVSEYLAHASECLRSRAPVEFDAVVERRATTTWWRSTMLPLMDETDRVARVFVTAIDVTEKKLLETAFRESRDRLEAVVNGAYDAIITVDHCHRIRFMNAAALRMFGWPAQEIVGEPLDLLLPKSIVTKHHAYLEAFQRSPIRARGMQERSEVRGVRRDGAEITVQVSISKVSLESGVETTAILRDVSDTSRLIAELKATASVDPLTGLSTRRRFIEALDLELDRARRQGRPLSLLMLDVDHFKHVNDSYGHPIGDAVLEALGRIIAGSVRAEDVVGRLGGEEFALLLPGAEPAQAFDIAERLRASVEAAAVADGAGGVVTFTVSVGVAGLEVTESTGAELLAAADRALYAAKNGGRNRVERAA